MKMCNLDVGAGYVSGAPSFKNSSCKPSTFCFNGQVRGMRGSGAPHNGQSMLCFVRGQPSVGHPFKVFLVWESLSVL